MNLTAELADKIAERYDQSLSRALRDLLQRDGLAILTEDARRDLILTLGDKRRSQNAWNWWNRNGGANHPPGKWSTAYRDALNAVFRRTAEPAADASDARALGLYDKIAAE